MGRTKQSWLDGGLEVNVVGGIAVEATYGRCNACGEPLRCGHTDEDAKDRLDDDHESFVLCSTCDERLDRDMSED